MKEFPRQCASRRQPTLRPSGKLPSPSGIRFFSLQKKPGKHIRGKSARRENWLKSGLTNGRQPPVSDGKMSRIGGGWKPIHPIQLSNRKKKQVPGRSLNFYLPTGLKLSLLKRPESGKRNSLTTC